TEYGDMYRLSIGTRARRARCQKRFQRYSVSSKKCRLCLSLKTGKKIDKCCSEESNGKFYCKLTKETYDNCCLRRPGVTLVFLSAAIAEPASIMPTISGKQ